MVSANDPDIRLRLQAARGAARAKAIADDATKALDPKTLSVGAQAAALMNVIDPQGKLTTQTADLAQRFDAVRLAEASQVKTGLQQTLVSMDRSRSENRAQAASRAIGEAHRASVEREKRTLATLEGVRAELAAANESEAESESRERTMLRLTAASLILTVIATAAVVLQYVL